MPEQNYHGPIGNVVNVDFSGELAGFLPTRARLTQRAWLAATLVNRQPQFEAIVDRIDDLVERSGGGKLLIVVRGIRPDVHQSLVLRCGLAHFGEYYDQENGWAYLGRIGWPRGAAAVLSVLRKLADALALPRGVRDQSAIERELASVRKSVCFSHYLDADWWTEREQPLVLDWVDYVCQRWPAPPVGRLVIAFLCLASGTGTSDPFVTLVAELRRRAGADRSGSVLVTEPLDLISASDVDDWVSEAARYLKLPALEGMLLTTSDGLFSPTRQPRRFADVYKGLCETLATLLPAGPTFTTADR
jgi:hypothetical protein